ncbi:ROK family protein, partial [Salegentibacter sp.]|uniref:ROK family transcriptional regulator n=1 Tax=Salegentibacter sp. TaxID=1903072 RepID=UPI0035684002
MPKKLQDFLIEEEKLSHISNVERKKYLQKLKIVKHLFLNGHTSNAEICSRFNVSLPTSMSLLNQMMEDGIVSKTGRGKSEGGRKPDLYGMQEHSFFVLSIHIERFRIKLAIIDNNHSIVKESTLTSEISPDSNIVDLLFEQSQNLLKSAKIEMSDLMGVGISMPGLVSAEAGKNFTYYLSEQEPESLKEKFEKKFRQPVVILNDA